MWYNALTMAPLFFAGNWTPPQDILLSQDDLLKEKGVDWIAVYNEWKNISFKKWIPWYKKGPRMSPEFLICRTEQNKR